MRLNFPPFAGWMGGDKEFGESEAATQLASALGRVFEGTAGTLAFR